MRSTACRYLKLYDPNELSSDKALRGRLVNAILASLRSPTLLTCDRLAQLPIVGALASDAEYAPLSRLLQIFAREMYGAYLEAHAEPATQTFMAAHGLEHAACERKMRLLSLTSLCAADKARRCVSRPRRQRLANPATTVSAHAACVWRACAAT